MTACEKTHYLLEMLERDYKKPFRLYFHRLPDLRGQ